MVQKAITRRYERAAGADQSLATHRRKWLLAAAGVCLWGEYENWRSSRRLVSGVAGSPEGVVVLGARNKGEKAHLLNRWRVRAWENIQNAIPLIEDTQSIKIVSNSLHAEKGRLYLARQRPDLAARLTRGSQYRFGESLPL